MTEKFNTEDMLDTYLLENQQLVEKLQTIALEQKDKGRFEENAIHDIFRTMHTIKASSSIMMFDRITTVSHKLEDVFSVLRDNQIQGISHLELVEHVLKVADFIGEELARIKKRESLKKDAGTIVESLDIFLKEMKEESGVIVAKNETQEEKFHQKYYIAPVMNPSNIHKKTEESGESKAEEMSLDIFIDLESSVEEIEARAERTQRQIMAESKTKTLVPGDFVIGAKETRRAKRVLLESKRFEKASYINVEIAKLDRLMDLVGQLISSQSAVLQKLDSTDETVAKMVDISTDLQAVAVSMRKTSLTQVFQKMNRIVFDVSRKLGKDIEFLTDGEMIEVDRNIVEHISDSLMHLVRNAVDHGIETAEEKVQAGKLGRSRIILSAKLEAHQICFIVEDNGKGLSRDRILQKARQKGLLDVNKLEDIYTDEEVFHFITLPGFSTKDSITEYSGRGVGMDVVVSNVASIGGRLDIESEEGKGSKMILTIPLT